MRQNRGLKTTEPLLKQLQETYFYIQFSFDTLIS